MMEERRVPKISGSMTHDELNRKIRCMHKCAKEEWLNNEYELIEKDNTKEPRTLHQRINNIIGRKNKSIPSSCLRAKNGNILLKKNQIFGRCTEYIGELFENDGGERPQIVRDINGPPILTSEARESLCLNKKKKATEPDESATEMINSLQDLYKN